MSSEDSSTKPPTPRRHSSSGGGRQHQRRCHITYVFFVLPPMCLVLYFALLAAPPPIPALPLEVHGGFDELPESVGVERVYPQDWLGEGGWAVFPFGRTRYWLTGPEDGLKVVLIHGLSVPALIYAPLIPHLLLSPNTTSPSPSKGFRILTYDLPARGYSSSLPESYHHDPALYTTHLALLLQHVGWPATHAVVGSSMGGAVAAAFAAAFPHLIEPDGSVVLLASAGLLTAGDLPRTAKLVASPVVQTLLSAVFLPVYSAYTRRFGAGSADPLPRFDLRGLVDDGEPRESVDPAPLGGLVKVQAAQLPGFNAAVSSSLRFGPVRGMEWAFEGLGRVGRRVLVVHGTKDRTVPPAHAQRIAELVRKGAEQLRMELQDSVASNSSSSSSSPTPSQSWFRNLPLPLPFSRTSASASANDKTQNTQVRVVMIPDAGDVLTWTHAGVVGRVVRGWLEGGDGEVVEPQTKSGEEGV
ncbi:AB hydrolase-1 domain-containing protein [Mycena chlorophos]|uniref:AB hydrolase-1 domain-containing protein n=1 Tax=Mycena chlorophos TaxID=658473 RepID=A0A8H6SAC4_MYCCL|nr:AB hydrolase-1 domain-containing protein [Mycena chlorophos]